MLQDFWWRRRQDEKINKVAVVSGDMPRIRRLFVCDQLFLDSHEQSCFDQYRAQCQVEERGEDHGSDRVDGSGQCADLGQSSGHILWDTKEVLFVEVAHQRVCHDIKCHATDGGYDGGSGDLLFAAFPGDMEDVVCHEACDQSDTELQEEGLRSAGSISGG